MTPSITACGENNAPCTEPNVYGSAEATGATATAAEGNITNTSAPSRSINAGAIAGGTVGAFLLFALIGIGILLYRRHRKAHRVAPSAEFLNASGELAFQRIPSFSSNSGHSARSNGTPPKAPFVQNTYPREK